MQLSPIAITSALSLVTLACSPTDHAGPDDSSSTSTDEASSSSGIDPSLPTGGESSDDSDTGNASSPETGESSSSGSTGEIEGDDSVWCGTFGTGAKVLESVGEHPQQVQFTGADDAPLAHVAWHDDDEVLRAITYDVNAAAWSEVTVLHDTGEDIAVVDAAADAQGNALVSHLLGDEDASAAVHQYDAMSGEWTTTILPDVLVNGAPTGVHITTGGDAIATFAESTDLGEITYLVYAYDAELGTWSEATLFGPFDSESSALRGAIDSVTGDAAFVIDGGDDGMAFHHRDPVSGEWTATPLGTPGVEQEVYGLESLGNGRFVAVTHHVGDIERVVAHQFDGGAWQSESEIVAEKADPKNVDYPPSSVGFVTATDGRALVAWFDAPSVLRLRSFDTQLGWSAAQDVNPPELHNEDPETGAVRLMLDGNGFMVGWRQNAPMAGVQAFTRRHDADGWGVVEELDPEHAAPTESIVSLDPLAHGGTRGVWIRTDADANSVGVEYACHVQAEGWGAPLHDDATSLVRYEPRRHGDLLVITQDEDHSHIAEYFVAQP